MTEGPDFASTGGPAERIRRLERRTGVYRPGRSPWVWILGPLLNAIGTGVAVFWLALGDLGWLVTVPVAVLGGLTMGIMAWAFMGTSWEQEQDERAAAAWYAGQSARPATAAAAATDAGAGETPRP